MKRGRKRKDRKTSQHVAPSRIFPLNAFAVDLGLFTESFKRRGILLALIAGCRTFPALGLGAPPPSPVNRDWSITVAGAPHFITSEALLLRSTQVRHGFRLNNVNSKSSPNHPGSSQHRSNSFGEVLRWFFCLKANSVLRPGL